MMTGMSWDSMALNRTDERPCMWVRPRLGSVPTRPPSSNSMIIMPASTVGKVRNDPASTGGMAHKRPARSRSTRSSRAGSPAETGANPAATISRGSTNQVAAAAASTPSGAPPDPM